jgi:hypothetical protein
MDRKTATLLSGGASEIITIDVYRLGLVDAGHSFTQSPFSRAGILTGERRKGTVPSKVSLPSPSLIKLKMMLP